MRRTSASNTVSVIATATNTVVASVPVGKGPAGVAVNPAGTFVFVTNNTDNSVSVINTANNSVVTTVPVGTGPQGVTVNPVATAFVYVTNNGSNNVSVIDTATNSVVTTWPVKGRTNVKRDHGMRAAADGVVTTVPVGVKPVAFGSFIGGALPPPPKSSSACIANSGSNSVSVIDIVTEHGGRDRASWNISARRRGEPGGHLRLCGGE